MKNVAVLVAIGVREDGYREILGVVEGMKVVAGMALSTTQSAQTQTSASSTPFQSGAQQNNSRGPRGGF